MTSMISVSLLSMLILIAAYLYSSMRTQRELNRLDAVLVGLLARRRVSVLIPRQRLLSDSVAVLTCWPTAIQVMNRLGIVPPEAAMNYNELDDRQQFEKTFTYFFMHGASAGYASSLYCSRLKSSIVRRIGYS